MQEFSGRIAAQQNLNGVIDKSPASDEKYYVQVGAFANRTNAEAYLAQVKKTYPDAFIKKF